MDSNIFDQNIGTFEGGKGKADLKTRERVNFVIDSLLMKQLRMLSLAKEVPMSRLVDNALRCTYNLNNNSGFSTILLISHEVKLYVYKESSSNEIKELLELIDKSGGKYILGDCLLAQKDNRMVGCQINFFIKGDEEKTIEEYVKFLKQKEIQTSIIIDDKVVQ